jgi:hypothetical protein
MWVKFFTLRTTPHFSLMLLGLLLADSDEPECPRFGRYRGVSGLYSDIVKVTRLTLTGRRGDQIFVADDTIVIGDMELEQIESLRFNRSEFEPIGRKTSRSSHWKTKVLRVSTQFPIGARA